MINKMKPAIAVVAILTSATPTNAHGDGYGPRDDSDDYDNNTLRGRHGYRYGYGYSPGYGQGGRETNDGFYRNPYDYGHGIRNQGRTGQ